MTLSGTARCKASDRDGRAALASAPLDGCAWQQRALSMARKAGEELHCAQHVCLVGAAAPNPKALLDFPHPRRALAHNAALTHSKHVTWPDNSRWLFN